MNSSPTITILVPRELRVYCDGSAELQLPGDSVRAALAELERRFPNVYRGACDETGRVRRHINLFVNSAHMGDRDGLDTPLRPGDVLMIMPAVSGG